MKNINCATTFKSFVYKTLILLEFTYSQDKLFYLVLVFLNEIQVLKCCLLVQKSSYTQQGKFISFLIYFFRPTYYFANFFKIYYMWIIFILIQVYYILWIHLLTIGNQSNENFIQVIRKYQLKSTFNYILVRIWKIFYVIQQEFFGFLIIEGNLIIILQDDNKFNQVIAFIILFQVLISLIVSDLFFNQSLQYIPKQLNQQISTSPLTLIQKLLKFSIICIFVSSYQYKQLLVFFISLLYSIIEIYIYLNLRIKLDKNIIFLSNLIQCLTIFIVFQEIINKLYKDNQNNSKNRFQFLWILVSLLLQFCIQKGLLQNHFFQQNLYLYSLKEASEEILMQCKQKLYKYQSLSIKQNSEFRLINFVILNNHISYCKKKECICQNQNLTVLNYESFLIKEITILFQYFLQQSQCQSSTFYIEFIQLLVFQGKYFEALNWIQKLLNTFNKHEFNQKYFQYFKGQVSLQDKIILTVLYQQLLLQIQSVIQSSTNEYYNASILQKAIKSLQQKVDSQQTIYAELNSILTMKIEYFIKIQNREKKDLINFDRNTHQILEKIESFKNKLELNFQYVPTHNNQSLLLYFQVEILNDLINSQTLSSMTSQINDEDIKNETNQIIDQLSSQFQVYAFALMDEDNIEFLPNYSNKNQKRKQRYTYFNDMIPVLISEIHKIYVRDFFQNGKNKFYLNISESILQIDTGIIAPIDMCMNVQFDLNMSRLIMIVFLKKQVRTPQNQIILLDSNFRINQMSKFLYQQFKTSYKNQVNQFIGKQIFQFIPNLQENHFIQDRNIGTFELSFIKINSSPLKSPFQSKDRYLGNLSVKVRNVKQKFIYYIVYITEIRSEKIEFQLNHISLPQIEFDEKEIVSIPIDNNQIQFDIQENFLNQHHQQISSRLETNRPFLYNTLGEAVEIADLQVEINKDLYIPSSNQSEISFQNKKIEVVNDIQKDFEDQGSQISSVAAVKRSLYYKQYLVINQLIFSKKFPNNIKKFNLFFLIFLIIGIINLILLILQVQQLQVYQELLSLLSIKYDIYEPIQSFLNTRYTIVALNEAVAIQLINQTEYNQLIVFPRSNLLRGYDDLKDNIYDVLSRQEFQSFLKDKYFESYWYETTTKSITKNITFRTGILALLEYQYDFKLAYTIRPIQTDGPYFFYSYENYISLINIFTDLSENILELLILELKKQSFNLFLITVPLSIISGFITIFYLFYLISQRNIKNKFLNLAYQHDIEILMIEISRLRQIQEFLNWNQDQIYHYSLDVIQYDNQLKEQEKEYLKFINKKSNKIQRKRFSNIKIFNYIQILILIVNIGLLQTIYSVTLDSLNKYLDKSSNTAIFYESLSSTGVDVLIAYSEREVLYRRIFIIFLQQSDIDDIIKLIEHSLGDIQNFAQKLTLLNQDDYLLDDQSLQLFDDVSQNSLCNYLPEEFFNYSTTLCPKVLLGVLNNGLYQTLNFMYNSIHSEIKINNFSLRNNSQIPIRELEGATFTAKVIKVLVQLLYNNIFNFTNRILTSFTIIFFCAIILEILIGLIIIIKFSEFEKKQINNLRKIVYLLPKSTLLFDDGFQRQIKNLIQISEVI